ncbi:MAG: hypothetical protein WA211_09780 [Candidatus Acidiferrales bacterium]
MNLPTTFQKVIGGVLFASFVLLGGKATALKPYLQASGEAVSGLQMTIYRERAASVPGKAPKFRIELRDAGENDLVLNLGMMLANGRKQYPDAVVLILTDAQAKSRRLDLIGPGGIAGRVDPFVLPLPAGATFSIPVELDKYWAAESKDFDYKLKPGAYTLEAQFTGKGVSQQEANLDVKGIALMPYWTGTVTSNRLRFEIPNK